MVIKYIARYPDGHFQCIEMEEPENITDLHLEFLLSTAISRHPVKCAVCNCINDQPLKWPCVIKRWNTVLHIRSVENVSCTKCVQRAYSYAGKFISVSDINPR